MSRLLEFKTFESLSTIQKNLKAIQKKSFDDLYGKYKELRSIVNSWSNELNEEDFRVVYVSEYTSLPDIGNWLREITDGEKNGLYKKECDGFFTLSALEKNQVIFFVRFDVNIKDSAGNITKIIINTGHNGEHLVINVHAERNDNVKYIEGMIKREILEKFDPEYKLEGMTINDYMYRNRGLFANKKFGGR